MALGSVLTQCSLWASPPQLRPWARPRKNHPALEKGRRPAAFFFCLGAAAFSGWIQLPPPPPYISRMSSLSSPTRAAPAGFIEPCLPSPADKPPSGSNWIHEIKHDGYRLMARRDPVGIRLLTRRGNDWANRYPLIIEAVNHLKVRSCLIDGEVVCCDDARPGHLPEAAPAGRSRRTPFLYAFDLLELDGADMRREPIEVRKATLGEHPPQEPAGRSSE